ncbi:MAG: YfhO family protein [Acidobacteria bacterium]|nr:YfhO family protein [Acidobacteriota bacterium]
MPRRFERIAPPAALLAEVLIFFHKVLFTSGYAIPYDLQGYHAPAATFAARALGSLRLPLWDPYTYCGFPYFANIQTQLFYPPAWPGFLAAKLAGLQHILKVLEWQLALHVFLGGLFTYLLLRRLGVGRASATFGATIFQLGAFFASQAQHLGAVCGAAWMPLTWRCVVELAWRFQKRWLAWLALSLSMTVLAGYPALTIVAFACCGVLVAALVLSQQSTWRLIPAVIAAGVWAVLLSAVQLLPTIELIGWSTAGMRGEWGSGAGMPLRALGSLLMPDYNGIFDLRTYKLPYNPTFLYLYCGISGLLLALAGIFTRRGAPFAGVAAVCGFWMLGTSTPLGKLVAAITPPALIAPTYAEFALAGFVLGVAVLAGLGVEQFVARRGRYAVAALVAVAFLELYWAGEGRFMNTMSLQEEPGVNVAQFEGTPVTLDRTRRLVYQTKPPARVDVFQDSKNWAVQGPVTEVPTANGDEPLAIERILRLRRLFAKGVPWVRYYEVTELDSPLLDLLNVRYLLSWAPSDELIIRHPKFPKVADLPGHHAYENRTVLPRFYLTGDVRCVWDFNDALAKVGAREFDPHRTVFVERPCPAATPRKAGGTVNVSGYGFAHVELDVNTPERAFLVTSETYYPGWRAWVDGRETAIYMTNAAFRGLDLEAGHHRVAMRFRPTILYKGAAVSLAALLLVAWAVRPCRSRY